MWLEADKDCLFLAGLRGFNREAYADYERWYRDPGTKHAICEDYRAGVSQDCVNDDKDKAAGRKIATPTLVLWGASAPLAQFDMLAIWKEWAPAATGHAIPGGHFFPEENPADTTAALHKFLAP
jgi:haloacetate dehalogenase